MMHPLIVPLYYMSSLAGLIMVIGGIWLLYKQKIYIDKETKEITEIEIPIIGKLKTNIPALVLFLLGFIPLIYPIIKSTGLVQEVKIIGHVEASAFPVQVYAVVESDSLLENRDFSLHVPVLASKDKEYKIIYIAGNVVVEDRADFKLEKNKEVRLKAKEIVAARSAGFVPYVNPVPTDF